MAELSEPIRTKLLKIDDVAAWTGIPINTLRYLRQVGRGPKAAKLQGSRRIFYRESDVQAWIDAQFDQAGA